MFKDAAPNLRLFADDEAKQLRVQVNALAGVGYLRPMWIEVARFSTYEDWKACKYASEVTNEDWLDDLAWFWHDLENPLPSPSQPQAPA